MVPRPAIATRVVDMDRSPREAAGLTAVDRDGQGRQGLRVSQEDSMPGRLAAAALAVLMTLTGAVAAEQWPTRPVTMVIPFAAGGPTDVLGRVIAGRMSEVVGQQVIVENIGGARGMTGSERVAKAGPDRYQFVLGTVGTHAQGQTLYKHPLY